MLKAIHADLQDLRRELVQLGDPAGGNRGGGRAQVPRTRARYQSELEDLAEQLEALEQSESYRIGHAIVRTLRSPLATLGKLRRPRSDGARASARSLKKGRVRATRTKTGAFPIPPGRRLLGPLNDKHSTTMFLLWGFSPDELESLTEDVASLQLMLRDFKPLFVTDSDHWSPFEERGYWFEYLPSADEWARYHDATEWPQYVSERIDLIIATYSPDRVIVYDNGPDGEALRRGLLNRIVSAKPLRVERPALQPTRR
jgi:hypothetical protein